MSKGAGVNVGPVTAPRGRDEALSAAVLPLGVPAPPALQSSPSARGSGIGDRGSGPGVWAAAGRQRLPPGTYARGGEATGHAPPAPPTSCLLKSPRSGRAAMTSSECAARPRLLGPMAAAALEPWQVAAPRRRRSAARRLLPREAAAARGPEAEPEVPRDVVLRRLREAG